MATPQLSAFSDPTQLRGLIRHASHATVSRKAGEGEVSPRQNSRPHQRLVHRRRALAALADRPDDQRLAAPHVAAGGENYIETVWGRGYVLRDPPGVEAARSSAKQLA